jgi:hypothetical protein
MAKLRLVGLLLVLSFGVSAQRGMTVAEVTAFVKSQVKLGTGTDHATAEYLLKNIKLTQKLDERTVEDLQGQGVGRETIRALHKLAADSASLPVPPPVVVAQPPPPPKPPDEAELAAALAAIKEYALNYSSSLPNYVCVQTTRRRSEPVGTSSRRGNLAPQGDTIQETLTYFEHKETYKVEMINGKFVANVSHLQLGGTTSSGEFGSMLSDIFKEGSGAEFAWEKWATLRGKRMYVFSYKIPRSNGYSMEDLDSHKEYTAAYRGLILADRETKTIQQITLDTVDVPPDFPIHEVHIKLDYDHVKIADQDFLLPYHYQLTSRADKTNTANEADFKAYRKYGAEATITFDDAPIPEEKLKEQPDTPPARQ